MGELDNKELKEEGNNIKDNDCLPEYLIPKKKKKKKDKRKEKECVDNDESIQQQNHEESTNKRSACNDEFTEAIEKPRKKAKKSSRHSYSHEEDEHKQLEMHNSEHSLNCRVEKKKIKREKDKKNKGNSDDYLETINNHDNLSNKSNDITIIHHRIDDIEDDSNYGKYPSSPENHSRKPSSSGTSETRKCKELTSESVERSKKKKKVKSKEFIENSSTDNEMIIDEQESSDRTAKKLKKKKKKRKEREMELNDDGTHEKFQCKCKRLQEISMNKEKGLKNNDNDSKSSSSSEEGGNGGVPRKKRPRLSLYEMKAAKIIAHDEEEVAEDVHALQRHHPLDAQSIAKLTSIHINLTHDVPPQHQVEKLAGTRVPTKEEKKEISKYIDIKKGTFTCDEDEIIIHNWKKFCKKYDWNKNLTHPFLHVKHKGFFYISPISERKKFVQLLAKGLHDRTLYSVYHRFRNLYSRHKLERYSPEEDAILLDSIQQNLDDGQKPNYVILAKRFNRTRASVWRRYVLLTKMRNKKKPKP